MKLETGVMQHDNILSTFFFLPHPQLQIATILLQNVEMWSGVPERIIVMCCPFYSCVGTVALVSFFSCLNSEVTVVSIEVIEVSKCCL